MGARARRCARHLPHGRRTAQLHLRPRRRENGADRPPLDCTAPALPARRSRSTPSALVGSCLAHNGRFGARRSRRGESRFGQRQRVAPSVPREHDSRTILLANTRRGREGCTCATNARPSCVVGLRRSAGPMTATSGAWHSRPSPTSRSSRTNLDHGRSRQDPNDRARAAGICARQLGRAASHRSDLAFPTRRRGCELNLIFGERQRVLRDEQQDMHGEPRERTAQQRYFIVDISSRVYATGSRKTTRSLDLVGIHAGIRPPARASSRDW